jgi:hypothetical protein
MDMPCGSVDDGQSYLETMLVADHDDLHLAAQFGAGSVLQLNTWIVFIAKI